MGMGINRKNVGLTVCLSHAENGNGREGETTLMGMGIAGILMGINSR